MSATETDLKSDIDKRASGMPPVDDSTGTRVVDARSPTVAEVETPKDRLPPSPPLTPVASLSNIRQARAAVPSKETVTVPTAADTRSDVTGQHGHAATHDGHASGIANMGVGIDASSNHNGVDDSGRPEIAHPLSSTPTATFLPSSGQDSPFEAGGPTPPPDRKGSLHGTENIHPEPDTPLSEAPSSPASPRHEPVMTSEPLASKRVPMPWDLVEPPRDSSLEDRDRRMKMGSKRSLNAHTNNIVVKE